MSTLWHNNPSPSVLMVNVAGSPEEPPVLPAAGQQRVYTRDSDGHLCRIDSGGGVTDIELAATASIPYLLYQDQKTQNTNGGTFTAGAWRTRDLNTEVIDTGGYGTLSSNQVTLLAGTYVVHASAPAYLINARHQLRLQNITDTATLATGTSCYIPTISTNMVSLPAILSGAFTISGTKVIELQHQCQSTEATDGFGVAANFGTEVYAVLELWRIGS